MRFVGGPKESEANQSSRRGSECVHEAAEQSAVSGAATDVDGRLSFARSVCLVMCLPTPLHQALSERCHRPLADWWRGGLTVWRR
ncbi:unnamed protein product [Vitrella brassicaformis CCMP3155]|uniref:Uncharacterized protein n=1 Tax=Vitrella brassicaformis (strain CCMP3155) TaxID=1169540 RepID=A0A0G4ET34_VITBC|nr:unnamed protein product [Vitrella brassicaformis CCMP3155]|eukprot:CEM00988.1 unnamed protein product [Vitrella brassicaformis CCMP3155]